MRKSGAISVLALCAAMAGLAPGCRRPGADQAGAAVPIGLQEQEPGELTVFAAASLTGCLDEFTEQFQQSHPGVTVRANYAGTQELRIQVEQGAHCDVFVSAAESHMEALVEGGYVAQTRTLAHNRLCVATEAGSGKVRSLSDLGQEGVRLVVATEACPVGRYTRRCWQAMASRPEFGPEYTARLRGNVVSEETNVKLVLLKVLLGEADAGFVYASDVLDQDVVTIELPEAMQVKATYMIGVMKGSPCPDTASSYVEGWLSPQGRQLLRAAGLEVPEPRLSRPARSSADPAPPPNP